MFKKKVIPLLISGICLEGDGLKIAKRGAVEHGEASDAHPSDCSSGETIENSWIILTLIKKLTYNWCTDD